VSDEDAHKLQVEMNRMHGIVERDPLGTDQHAPGAKLDEGKVRAGLVLRGFSRALIEVARIGTNGAKRYTDDGWMSVPDGEARYDDALFRHLLQPTRRGLDPTWNLTHAAHAAWNALATLELMLRDMEAKNGD
jgi:hypothetical protein